MQNRYKFIIILIVLLSISSVSATNLDNNYTSTNEKSIINDISNFNKIDNNYNNNELSDLYNYDDDLSNDKIYNNESSYNEISDDKTYDNEIPSNETSYDGEIFDNNDSSSLKAPSSNSNITYSYNEILICANKTNNFIKENHYIPAVVKIGNKNVTINDYLHLLCKSLDSTTSQSINTTKYVMSTTGTNCHNMKISKKDYLSLADSIVKCYNINLRNPLKISIYNNTLSFDDAVYFFTKIISWKYTHNGALLGSEVVTALYNYDYSKEENALITTTTQPFTINTTYTKISNETYELTLTPSETCTIYYTRNGTIPTTKDKIYTSPLTIYNSTWIQYYGVNKNNQKTPILSFGIYRPATAYITNKPQQKNQYEKIVNIASSHESTIYYTINGTKPTTESTKYTKPITINNYTILQYFSVTQEGKKSSTYYYKIQDPTPYTTIINKTEVQDNHQIVIVIANKPGTIYYTRNGTIPTT